MTDENHERAMHRAAVEAGYASHEGYVEKYKSDGTVVPTDTHQAELQAALARAEQFRKEYEHELAEGRIYGAISNEMTRQRDAALARAEAAKAELERLKLETVRADNEKKRADHYEARAEAAERQRDPAFTAGAEAMREACAKAVWPYVRGLDDVVRALPIPAQEVGLVAHCVNNCSRQGPYGDVACGDCEMRPTSKTP